MSGEIFLEAFAGTNDVLLVRSSKICQAQCHFSLHLIQGCGSVQYLKMNFNIVTAL